jgi:hypothetical protein
MIDKDGTVVELVSEPLNEPTYYLLYNRAISKTDMSGSKHCVRVRRIYLLALLTQGLGLAEDG